MKSCEICVVGAGVIGRRIARELAAAGVPFAIASRRGAPELGQARTHVADVFDRAALAEAVADCRVVIDAAAPLRETAAPVLTTAMSAGAHYVDVGGEQAALQALYERHDSTVRRAGMIALPGAGLDCVLGDLAIDWAAAHLSGVSDDGPAVRTEPATRIAASPGFAGARSGAERREDMIDAPLDEACVTYVFDDLVVSAGSQRALFGGIGERALVWRRDRWEPGRAADRRRVNAGVAMGGERDGVPYAGGDPLAIPRHVAVAFCASFVSTTRNAASGTLMRLLAGAAPLLPRAAADLFVPFAPPEDELARTRFAVVAQVRRGFSAAQITIRGSDPYRTTAAIVAWIARALVTRGPGPLGMRAPGEVFRPAPALRALAAAADLSIEPSFGR